MNITEYEMRGLLAGKCLPGDMRVNEELPAYLVRKFVELKAQRDALSAIVQRVIDTGELARPEHESLEAELCALAASDGQTSCDARQDFEALIMLISRGLADVEKGINGYHDPQIQAFWENYQFSKDIRAGEPS